MPRRSLIKKMKSGMSLKQRQPVDSIKTMTPELASHQDPRHKCDRPGFSFGSPLWDGCKPNPTHREEIEYLRKAIDSGLMCPVHYENVEAAIKYHEQFPLDELCDDTIVYFQHGRQLASEKDIDHQTQACWVEGSFDVLSVG